MRSGLYARQSTNRFTIKSDLGMQRAPVAVLVAAAVAGDTATIRPREQWSAVFGETDTTFSFEIAAARDLAGRVAWSLSAQGRTISRGEREVQAAAGQTVRVDVPVRIPPVRDGIVFPAQLALAVVGAGEKPSSRVRKGIWVFPRDPFTDRRQWPRESEDGGV